MNLTLVVLAAGIGSRYGGLKQMDPIGPSGEFIVDYSVYDSIRAGFNKVVFVIRRDIEEAFKGTIGDRVARHVRTEYAFQELTSCMPPGFAVPASRKKPWGTGHAVLVAEDCVDGPFAVINGDDFYGSNAYAVLAGSLGETASDGSAYCMVAYKLRNTLSDYGSVARGICGVASDGTLDRVVETLGIEKHSDTIRSSTGHLTGNEPTSLNCWGFKPSLFSHLRAALDPFLESLDQAPQTELFLPTVVNSLVQTALVRVLVLNTTSTWFGMTNRDDREVVGKQILELIGRGEYPSDLWASR